MSDFRPYRQQIKHPAWQEVMAFTGDAFRQDWCHGNDAKVYAERELYPDAETFYRETDVYLYHGVAFFLEGIKRPYYSVLLSMLSNMDASILDYGCGCGDDGLLFASLGFNVTLADIPSRSLDFARWRCEARGHDLDIRTIGFDQRPLSADPEHMIVWCCDVLEHIPPGQHMAFIRTLRSLGQTVYLVLVNDPAADGRVHYQVDVAGLTDFASTLAPIWFRDFYQGRTRMLVIGGLAELMYGEA